ncbi:uncharacterized protein LOC126882275 [Diabrotica virgifera virgifera]|uniref:Uncharacterized protein n=1 Tax=Diabrotica virgifera virgifera TaxID=50390 RepID=A0ABM5JYQ1_DIAVI|nr:uncharacterized protein LOC126882275 [Diabrotica virgifera virgifera]
MTGIPTTLVVTTTDEKNLPLEDLMVFVKHIFSYGVTDIRMSEDRILIILSYSPRAVTLRKKFNKMPVRYVRTKVENERELSVLERLMNSYKFNILDEEELDAPPKKKLSITDVYSDDDDDDEDESTRKKFKK